MIFPFYYYLSGAAPALRTAATCGGGDEAGPDRARLGTVPQDLHPEARERQVRSQPDESESSRKGIAPTQEEKVQIFTLCR